MLKIFFNFANDIYYVRPYYRKYKGFFNIYNAKVFTFVELCVDCQTAVDDIRPREKNNRPVEEEILLHDDKFGFAFNDFDDTDNEVGFDAEDSYQAVQSFDWRSNVDSEFLDEDPDCNFVDPLDQISNQQYKNQLLD